MVDQEVPCEVVYQSQIPCTDDDNGIFEERCPSPGSPRYRPVGYSYYGNMANAGYKNGMDLS